MKINVKMIKNRMKLIDSGMILYKKVAQMYSTQNVQKKN